MGNDVAGAIESRPYFALDVVGVVDGYGVGARRADFVAAGVVNVGGLLARGGGLGQEVARGVIGVRSAGTPLVVDRVRVASSHE